MFTAPSNLGANNIYKTETRFGSTVGWNLNTISDLVSECSASTTPPKPVLNGAGHGTEFKAWFLSTNSTGKSNAFTFLSDPNNIKVSGYTSAKDAMSNGNCYLVIEPITWLLKGYVCMC